MYGFSKSNYETFQTSYSQYMQNVAKNDYMEVSLFKQVRQEIGKDNFQKFLTDTLGLTDKEISTLRNKLMAFDRLSDKTMWETLGYSNINKILSLPKSVKNTLIERLQNGKLTLSSFSTIYNEVVSGDMKDSNSVVSSRREGGRSISSAQIQQIVMESINRALASEKQPQGGKRERRQDQRNRNRNRGQRRNQNWNRHTTCSSQPVFPFVTA